MTNPTKEKLKEFNKRYPAKSWKQVLKEAGEEKREEILDLLIDAKLIATDPEGLRPLAKQIFSWHNKQIAQAIEKEREKRKSIVIDFRNSFIYNSTSWALELPTPNIEYVFKNLFLPITGEITEKELIERFRQWKGLAKLGEKGK